MPTQEEIQANFMKGVEFVVNQIDRALYGASVSPNDPNKPIGFILLMFPRGVDIGGCTIANNGIAREDVINILRTQSEKLQEQLVGGAVRPN